MSNIPIDMPEDMVEGSQCLEKEVPWIVPEAVYKLDQLLDPNDIVYEIGSGGSTLFFARRCYFVNSIETSNDWGKVVMERLIKESINNAIVSVIPEEKDIVYCIKNTKDKDFTTVFSVDSQGGYNRSELLNSFLSIPHPNLRMIILDNYAHEGLFPDHWNSFDCGFHDWTVMTFDHPRWAGSGTKILLKNDTI